MIAVLKRSTLFLSTFQMLEFISLLNHWIRQLDGRLMTFQGLPTVNELFLSHNSSTCSLSLALELHVINLIGNWVLDSGGN